MTNTNNNNVALGNSGATVLDQDSYPTLLGMLKSNNAEDHVLAQNILTRLDVEKSIWYIYELSRNCYTSRMVNLRTKAGRKFRDDTNLFTISSMPRAKFAEWLHRKGWLTSERYELCKDAILATITNKCNNIFFKVNIELKDDFKHLDLEDKNITICA